MEQAVEQPPSKPRRRRWLSFSLRAFFVLLTALCVWLGYQVNAARRQREAVVLLEKLGAYVAYDVADPNMVYEGGGARPPDLNAVERWIAAWLGKDYVTTAIRVQIYSAKVRDEDLQDLAELPGLEVVTLSNCPLVTGSILTRLPASKSLMAIDLYKSPVSESSLSALTKFPNLGALNVAETGISDAGLQAIGNLRNLRSLGLSGINVSAGGIKHLEHLTQLLSLTLTETSIGDEGLRTIGRFHALESLSIDGGQITDAGLAELAGLDQLGGLWLKRTQVQGSGLRHFADCKSLIVIRLDGCPLNDEAVPAIASVNSLWGVDLRATTLSAEAVAELQTLRPKLRITPP
ncbi:MAG: hypothetical protein SGJ19_02160 [Planctomycetia bacterium]|nr:hypothetical protein [Planctomycetia bacterium]